MFNWYQLSIFQITAHILMEIVFRSSWPQPSYLNSKLFGLWDFHLTKNGRACLHMRRKKQLLANYNFFHCRTRHWHVERTALFACSAATWGEILITFRISAVSLDNEVILPWERRYWMERLQGQAYPLWYNHKAHNLSSAKGIARSVRPINHILKEGSFLITTVQTLFDKYTAANAD